MCETKTNYVFYRGKAPCDVLFIGEAPGENEDLSGEPFVGKAGDLLDKMILDLEQENVLFSYGITNILSCFPFTVDSLSGKRKARAPKKEEASACSQRLLDTIHIAFPKVIVILGKSCKKYLKLPKKEFGTIPTIELMHPAGILRRGGIKSLDYKRNYFELRDNLSLFLNEKKETETAALET